MFVLDFVCLHSANKRLRRLKPAHLTTSDVVHVCNLWSELRKTAVPTVAAPRLLTLPPPGVCLMLSLEPQRAWTLLRSIFLSRIWTWRMRERKRRSRQRCQQVAPQGEIRCWRDEGWFSLSHFIKAAICNFLHFVQKYDFTHFTEN